jgi:hypothetical protein
MNKSGESLFKEEANIKRPRTITVIGWGFVATGCITFVAGFLPLLDSSGAQQPDEIGLILFIRILAVVAGAFLLNGSNRARWLIVVWLGYHVILSVWHPLFQLIVHGLLAAALVYFLFRPQASAYFRGATTPSPISKSDETLA